MLSLLAGLLALALLLSPGTTSNAAAAVPHHKQMMERTGDCHVPSTKSAGHDKSASKTCCISTCIAVTIDASAGLNDKQSQRPPLTFPLTTFQTAFPAEVATPPPRFS